MFMESLMKRLLILAALATTVACGQSPTTATPRDEAMTETAPGPVTTTPTPPVLGQSSGEFAQRVANSNQFDIEASRLAAQQARRADVKAFARTVAADRESAARELAQAAPQAQLSAPMPQLDATQQANLNTLRSSPSNEFDKAYLDQQVAEQRETVRTFEEFVNTAPDSALRQWAQRRLPKLQQNLDRAEALAEAT
jgi:putative membrane protein